MPNRSLANTLSRAATWPAEAQAELAAYAAEIEAALAAGEYTPSDAELAGIDRGHVATPEQLAATFARHRPA